MPLLVIRNLHAVSGAGFLKRLVIALAVDPARLAWTFRAIRAMHPADAAKAGAAEFVLKRLGNQCGFPNSSRIARSPESRRSSATVGFTNNGRGAGNSSSHRSPLSQVAG